MKKEHILILNKRADFAGTISLWSLSVSIVLAPVYIIKGSAGEAIVGTFVLFVVLAMYYLTAKFIAGINALKILNK